MSILALFEILGGNSINGELLTSKVEMDNKFMINYYKHQLSRYFLSCDKRVKTSIAKQVLYFYHVIKELKLLLLNKFYIFLMESIFQKTFFMIY